MPVITYYAKLEKVEVGYEATVPVGTTDGIEEVIGNGRTPSECSEHTKLALTTYINLQKEEGKLPGPVWIRGALPLEIKIMNTALIIQRDRSIGILLQEILSDLDYEFTHTDNLEDAVRFVNDRRYDAIITGSMYKTAPGEEVDDTAWEKLHEEVSKQQPDSSFILFTSVGDIDPSNYDKPKVHFISKIALNKEELFRRVLP